MNSNKILKVIVVISYLSIPIIGTKVGGPLLMFLLFWVLDVKNTGDFVVALTVNIALVIWIFSIIKNNQRIDRIVLPILLLPMFYPIIGHIVYLWKDGDWINATAKGVFILGLLIFLALVLKLFNKIYLKSKKTFIRS